MRIIHISDFHFDFHKLEDFKNYVITPLITDIIKANKEKKIDLIAFSEDLVEKGGLSFNNDIEGTRKKTLYSTEQRVLSIGIPLYFTNGNPAFLTIYRVIL